MSAARKFTKSLKQSRLAVVTGVKGPVAFMHRPSAENIVLAPLGHHTFDSTHVSFGVISAADNPRNLQLGLKLSF